jgi:toluene monooxygenase system protein E
MASAYVGSMAPSGRLAVALLLQTADQLRCVQRLAFRLGQLRRTHPKMGDDAKQRWQQEPCWQSLRRLVEQLLVTYDWGEAFAALDLVIKPAFDEAFLLHFAQRARDAGDDVLHKLLRSLYRDSEWQRQWTHALVAMLVAEDACNAQTLGRFIARWWPRTRRALLDLEPVCGGTMVAGVGQKLRDEWASLRLDPLPAYAEDA